MNALSLFSLQPVAQNPKPHGDFLTCSKPSFSLLSHGSKSRCDSVRGHVTLFETQPHVIGYENATEHCGVKPYVSIFMHTRMSVSLHNFIMSVRGGNVLKIIMSHVYVETRLFPATYHVALASNLRIHAALRLPGGGHRHWKLLVF